MCTPSASELLNAWERGLGQSPPQRALTLLAATSPETPPEALAKLSIGQRDASLLALREWIFGPQVASLATCLACGERLELNFNINDIRATTGSEQGEPLSFELDDYEVQFRLPNSLDLLAIAGCLDVSEGRGLLLARCILRAQQEGEARTADQLPAGVVEALVERMARADPQADVQLALSCPLCGHRWLTPFDILSFFWAEVNAWAWRILREVHSLARAYGWREADILAMSQWRRHVYLEMISG